MRFIIGYLTTAFLLISLGVRAQGGCTDPAATNYSASATSNDGSCLYPVTHYSPLVRAAFGAGIDESSGLVYSDGKLWTHNDSGNPPQIFSVDTSTGAILQTVYIDNYPNTDWEDIAADSAYIYIGNFGNNNGTRTDLQILKVAKAGIGSAATVHVNAQAINFSYTDQTSFASSNTHNFDCESLIAIKDSLYLFTKDRGDYRSRVYKMPKTPGTYALTSYTSFNAGGLVTGADYNPVTKEIVLIGYLSGHSGSFLWFLNDYRADSFFTGNKRRIEIGNGAAWQTEGVCWFPGNRFLVSCELTNSIPSSFYVCNRNLQSVTASVGNVNGGQKLAVYPNPAQSLLQVRGMTSDMNYVVFNSEGQRVLNGSIAVSQPSLKVSHLIPGLYRLALRDRNGLQADSLSFIKQ